MKPPYLFQTGFLQANNIVGRSLVLILLAILNYSASHAQNSVTTIYAHCTGGNPTAVPTSMSSLTNPGSVGCGSGASTAESLFQDFVVDASGANLYILTNDLGNSISLISRVTSANKANPTALLDYTNFTTTSQIAGLSPGNKGASTNFYASWANLKSLGINRTTGAVYFVDDKTLAFITTANTLTVITTTIPAMAGSLALTDLAVDAAGNTYLAIGNGATGGGIYKISSAGAQTGPLSGTSTGAYMLDVDDAGNVFYINNANSSWVTKLTPAGVSSTVYNTVPGKTILDLSISPNGNTLSVSTYWGSIVTVSPAASGGTVTTIISAAGSTIYPVYPATGTPTASAISDVPYRIESTNAGGIYFADRTGSGFASASPSLNFLSNSTPLPITLVNFSGKKEGNSNLLQWETADVKDFSGFEIQKDTEGKGNFTTIATLNYNNDQNQYRYTDAGISNDAWYRLALVDRSGNTTYSNTVYLHSSNTSDFSIGKIYPSPASGVLNVQISAPKATTVTYAIMDMMGRTWNTEQHDASGWLNQQLDISALSNGTYMLKITAASGATENRRFTKLQ